jgi:hypothetical protein
MEPHFLDLGTRWRRMVSFTPLPLYPRTKNHPLPKVDPRAGLDDTEKWKFLILAGFKLLPLVVQPVDSRYTD